MPELPEVETTRRGIRPHIEQQTIDRVIVRESRLRWPVPAGLDRLLRGQRILSVGRRAKYLLLETGKGHLLIHLGMSGSLRLVPDSTPAARHDHVDIVFAHDQCLRLHDPRRFGAVLWCDGEPKDHPLLRKLGPEPLEEDFDGDYLYQALHRRKAAIKLCLMDNKVVVGVGNIYANEALFLAGIHPGRSAARISRARIVRLAQTVREVLAAAITQGGTTLRDFVGGDGKPGYFAQQLHVYGRGGEGCDRCGHVIQQITQGQRSSWYCPHCQR